MLDLVEIFLNTNNPTNQTVKNFWEIEIGVQWRKWKRRQHWPEARDFIQWANYDKEMDSRRVVIAEGPYIISWGYRIKGMFTIQEGYHLQAEHQQQQGLPIWEHIWKDKLWPKTTFFLWVVHRGRALTWDQLQVRGMQGPLVCCTCEGQIETMEHLLNACSYNKVLWQNHEKLFGHTDKDQTSTKTTMEKWRKKIY